jgi:hypothetical protein
MKTNLSNLLDLALGKPHYINCDQLNILHTLLYILLEKLKFTESEVELEGDFGNKIEKLNNIKPQNDTIKLKEV